MVPPHPYHDLSAPPGDAYPTLVLSLIRLHGYREPGDDVLDTIVREAVAAGAAESDAATRVDTHLIDRLDRSVRAAAAAGRLRQR